MINNSNYEIIDLISDDEETFLDINFVSSKENEEVNDDNNLIYEIPNDTTSQYSQDKLMITNLISSLEKPLDKKNKGYRMLEKYGYREGGVIGKNNKGLRDPINITPLLRNIHLNHPYNKNKFRIHNFHKKDNLNLNNGGKRDLCIMDDIQLRLNTLNNEKIDLCRFIQNYLKYQKNNNQLKGNMIIISAEDCLKILLEFKQELELNFEKNYNKQNIPDQYKKIWFFLTHYDISIEQIIYLKNSFNKLKRLEYNIENIVDLLKYLKEIIMQN
jgi:hypothetical protein